MRQKYKPGFILDIAQSHIISECFFMLSGTVKDLQINGILS